MLMEFSVVFMNDVFKERDIKALGGTLKEVGFCRVFIGTEQCGVVDLMNCTVLVCSSMKSFNLNTYLKHALLSKANGLSIKRVPAGDEKR